MRKSRNRIIAVVISLCCIAVLLRIGLSMERTSGSATDDEISAAVAAVDVSLTAVDKETDTAGAVTLLDGSETGDIIIESGGVYLLSGTLNGSVIIRADEDEDVRLILNNLTVRSTDNAALYAESADKVILTLAEGSENIFTDTARYADTTDADACIMSNCNLTINGSGTLAVTGLYTHGIHTKDNFKLVSGTVEVSAKSKGVYGKDKVVVYGGTLSVQAEGDGICSDQTSRTDEGFVWIEGGEVSVVAGGEGIEAVSLIYIDTCNVSLRTVKEAWVCSSGITSINESCVTR